MEYIVIRTRRQGKREVVLYRNAMECRVVTTGYTGSDRVEQHTRKSDQIILIRSHN